MITENLIVDGFGHLFYLLIFFGMVKIKERKEIGWLFRLGGEIGWAAIGLYLGLSSIVLWAIPFIYVDYRGYNEWKKLQ